MILQGVFLVCFLSIIDCASIATTEDESLVVTTDTNYDENFDDNIESSTVNTKTKVSREPRVLKINHSGLESRSILFPDIDTNINRHFSNSSKHPVTNYAKCAKNEWLYPGNVENDWV